jgi:hypothetical protein
MRNYADSDKLAFDHEATDAQESPGSCLIDLYLSDGYLHPLDPIACHTR